MGGDSGMPQVNQCWLVKVPSRTRQMPPSPFSDGEDDDQKPMVVDMIKPQAPEGAWGNSQPSGSESEPTPEPHPSTSTVRSKPQQKVATTPATPRVSKVTPAAATETGQGGTSEETQRTNPALFIAPSPTASPDGAQVAGGEDSSKRRSKGKCVIS